MTISARNEEVKASEVEIAHRHMGRRATMKDSIEAAAYHAWVTLRGNRFDAIRQGHDRHLPRAEGLRRWMGHAGTFGFRFNRTWRGILCL